MSKRSQEPISWSLDPYELPCEYQPLASEYGDSDVRHYSWEFVFVTDMARLIWSTERHRNMVVVEAQRSFDDGFLFRRGDRDPVLIPLKQLKAWMARLCPDEDEAKQELSRFDFVGFCWVLRESGQRCMMRRVEYDWEEINNALEREDWEGLEYAYQRQAHSDCILKTYNEETTEIVDFPKDI